MVVDAANTTPQITMTARAEGHEKGEVEMIRVRGRETRDGFKWGRGARPRRAWRATGGYWENRLFFFPPFPAHWSVANTLMSGNVLYV